MTRVQYGVMLRMLPAAALLVLVPAYAPASPSPAPSVSPDATRPRDGGLIEGRITTIDFQRSSLSVDSPARGKLDVSVMPSTSIEMKAAGYHAITDLRSGERVEIVSSVINGKFVAQIIRVL